MIQNQVYFINVITKFLSFTFEWMAAKIHVLVIDSMNF